MKNDDVPNNVTCDSERNTEKDSDDLQSEIRRLREENAFLCEKLKMLESEINRKEEVQGTFETKTPKCGSHLVDASCQTEFVVIEVDLTELKKCSQKPLKGEILNTESITEAAQTVLNKSGWVYDKHRGIYFDYNTNLYYYPSTRLYYNYKTGCYYKYNQESQQYEFQYQLETFKNKTETSNPKSGAVDNAKEVAKNTDEGFYFPPLKKVVFDFGSSVTCQERGKENYYNLTKKSWNKEIFRRVVNRLDKPENSSENRGDSDQKHINESLSDSEMECIKSTKKKYLVCRRCTTLITTCCCKIPVNKKNPKNCHTGESPIENDIGLCTEEFGSSCSDSEVDSLSTSRRKYVCCRKCKTIANTICCERLTPLSNEANKRRQSFETNEGTTKRLCTQNRNMNGSCQKSSFNTAATEPFSTIPYTAVAKEKVDYSMDYDCQDLKYVADLELETSVIPCIRAMVTSSNGLKVGTLFLITCTGATIGSGEHCDIQIEEDGVSEEHAAISYNQQQRNYFVTDIGSETGTTLNSTTQHNPGSTTVLATLITHKSVLLIGESVFVLHLHMGYETCDDCEPGQIQAMLGASQPIDTVRIVTKKEKEDLRRSEMKSIKKKYNLHKDKYKQPQPVTGTQYADRASERRRTKGSDNPYEKDEIPTSFETELADHNVGHQMLKKMGWNKGQGLGKTQKGITEPIVPQGSGKGKFGLGFGNVR